MIDFDVEGSPIHLFKEVLWPSSYVWVCVCACIHMCMNSICMQSVKMVETKQYNEDFLEKTDKIYHSKMILYCIEEIYYHVFKC